MGENNFQVKEAVWLAAAAYAYINVKNGRTSIADISLTAAQLQNLAKNYTTNDVNSARIYQHYNADHDQNTANYLRKVSINNSDSYRILGAWEYTKNSKEKYPSIATDDFYKDKNIDIQGESVSIGDLYKFVSVDYRKIIESSNANIEYQKILDFVNDDCDIEISQDENTYELLETQAEIALEELRKIASKCKSEYKLDNSLVSSWKDFSGKKTRRNLWLQLRYGEYDTNPVSISIFVEKDALITRFRVCLDIKDGVTRDEMAKYHSHLDMPLTKALSYGYSSNEWGNPLLISETQETIKNKITSGDIRKVQICSYVNSTSGKNDAQYGSELMLAVKEMIPYYDYVIGRKTQNIWWPAIEDFNPEISKNEWTAFINDSYLHNTVMMKMLKFLLEHESASCKKISSVLGGSPFSYNAEAMHFGRRSNERFHVIEDDLIINGIKVGPTSIPFLGKSVNGLYEWKLRDELKEALEEMDLSNIEANKVDTSKYDKNTILYGPPGTGKTYNSATYAVAICDGKDVAELTDYDEVMERYNELKKAGRIAFTTFHQSYGYEEFIEGIKPVLDGDSSGLSYKIEPGIFKQFCDRARIPEDKSIDLQANIFFVRLKDEQDKYSKGEISWDISDDWYKQRFVDDMQIGDYILSYAGNGVFIDAIAEITSDPIETENSNVFKRNVEWTVLPEKIDIRSINNNYLLPRFSMARMNHMSVASLSKYLINGETNAEPYVFIIDEINRGNISKIFGELITLIENTKREGMPEAASAILPYSHEAFSVPSNLYILGTMNTADRSIQLMDTALRRRFQFIEKMPDTNVLRNLGINDVDFNGTTINIPKMLDAINDRIAYLFDREHTIGHAFFTGLKDEPSIDKLASIFEKSVIPLLQEYFYEDYQKIQLVLGDNAKSDDSTKFIVNTPANTNIIFMGSVEDYLDEREETYTINHDAFRNIMAYKQIANNL